MQEVVFGRVEDNNGNTVFKSVLATITTQTKGTNVSWWGTFRITSGETPIPFQGFIITKEGMKSEIGAMEVDPKSVEIHFRGSGAPPIRTK